MSPLSPEKRPRDERAGLWLAIVCIAVVVAAVGFYFRNDFQGWETGRGEVRSMYPAGDSSSFSNADDGS